MPKFAGIFRNKLEADLKQIDNETSDVLKRAERSILCVVTYLKLCFNNLQLLLHQENWLRLPHLFLIYIISMMRQEYPETTLHQDVSAECLPDMSEISRC